MLHVAIETRSSPRAYTSLTLNIGTSARMLTPDSSQGRLLKNKSTANLPYRSARAKPPKSPGAAKPPKPLKTLKKVLLQTQHVTGIVQDAAEDLSSVNSGLKQATELQRAPPQVEEALGISETAEGKVQDAADKLAVVNSALKDAVQERLALEIQLAEVTEREEASRHASFHDPLTGLPNRALSNDRLEHGVAQAKRHGWQLAVMFIDLDDFKKINDRYGHEAGDHVLKTISTRLSNSTRDDDTLSRHGGDEFLYVLTEYENEHDLTSIAESLVTLIQTPVAIRVDRVVVNTAVSASIGIAIFPRHGDTPEALIKSADSAMYRAKRSRFRFSFAR